ncbi:hypothetical protein RS022_04950 [Candidatus Phytoplasma rubi]|uniref:Uncharacterized protein n=1 Tax=Candidatus Phytoplasma rubi TaxID=399025 RepID=A0ABY7BTL2_9MOLU|nr:hypothetical protein RS022_04950 [Candidatus Phytoplasma rubi]
MVSFKIGISFFGNLMIFILVKIIQPIIKKRNNPKMIKKQFDYFFNIKHD